MTARHYALLAAVVFALVAMLQVVRAMGGLAGRSRSIVGAAVASWFACAVAAVLAALGFAASRR